MGVVTRTAPFTYAVGEEVVVELEGISAFDVSAGGEIDGRRLPGWTIGDVRARAEQHGRPMYAVRFRLGDGTCIALVDELAIAGTA